MMKLKPNAVYRSLTCLSWTATLGLLAFTVPTAIASAAIPSDEPLCYMRTQDGRVVNLQSLCSRSTAPQLQSSPVTNQPTQRPSIRATPTQVIPTRARNTSGSHTQGNPDADDGRY